jgi:hypothetical protein
METAVEIASEPITQDLAVIDELHELIRPSYEKATTLLARETCFCDTLYTLRGPNDNLVAFFMVAWHQLELDDTSIQAVYLGLSATRQDTKSTGSVRHVYQRFANDARRWEHRTGKELLLWFTTATPSAYYAAQRLFDGLQPRTNGTYTSHGKRVANALRNYVDADRGEQPSCFTVLRRTRCIQIEKWSGYNVSVTSTTFVCLKTLRSTRQRAIDYFVSAGQVVTSRRIIKAEPDDPTSTANVCTGTSEQPQIYRHALDRFIAAAHHSSGLNARRL